MPPIKQDAPLQSWPADHVERRAVASLVPYARNARTHSPEQVAQIAASIREWGWTTPVLIHLIGHVPDGFRVERSKVTVVGPSLP